MAAAAAEPEQLPLAERVCRWSALAGKMRMHMRRNPNQGSSDSLSPTPLQKRALVPKSRSAAARLPASNPLPPPTGSPTD
ncbi:hypothetical protein CDD83_5544 [Cordyceps sp. RAO-2017]|nr:hypothetical protein CDD83_5544 [Cordyceps sp. RAO-2017]